MNISKRSLELLVALFSKESALQLPVSLLEQVVEIRQAAAEELAKLSVEVPNPQ